MIDALLFRKIDNLNETVKKQTEIIQEKEKEIQNLRQQLAMEKISSESERKQHLSQVIQLLYYFSVCIHNVIF